MEQPILKLTVTTPPGVKVEYSTVQSDALNVSWDYTPPVVEVEKIVEKEVVKEVIVEKPVEKIVEKPVPQVIKTETPKVVKTESVRPPEKKRKTRITMF